MLPKSLKKKKNVLKKCKIGHKSPKKSWKKRWKVSKSWALLTLLAIFWQHIQILFIAVTQCDKQFVWLLQRFSATNLFSVCHSNSVWQTILTIFFSSVACDKGIGKKPKTNTLPNLNFTSAIKLLWGTFHIRFQVLIKTVSTRKL